ncbi:MAG: glycosyltransferase [Betaproteobacteria bacterium]|nr:glycosyltransferase [Betaproteobacteria bacterium]
MHILLLGYRNEPATYRQEGNLHWHAVSALHWGPWPYLAKAGRLAADVKPDWVFGLSDTWYGILAERLARRHGARSLIDAYDNYESYIPWLKPLHGLWRRALARADAVTAVGPQLAAWMSTCAGGRPVEVIPMAADPIFAPLDKAACRQQLGLPADATLVGYAGALHPSRDMELLFQTYARLRAADLRIELVLSGRLAKGIALPAGTHWLGYRPAEEVPLILNSLDLVFVLNKPGAFGDYSYPAKLYEALACGVPVVAADVPGTAWVLRDRPESLARAGDAEDMARKAGQMLALGKTVRPVASVSWQESTDKLEEILQH